MNDNAKTDNGIRLNKYLSEAGICSRREADRLIEDGKVTVDGRTASMGMKVFTSQEITVNGKRVEGKERPVLLAVNTRTGRKISWNFSSIRSAFIRSAVLTKTRRACF